jgi:DNA-binding transcriptional ArsR family regulator
MTALADPTRRRLFERIRKREYSVGTLARMVRITQPAVSQHLAVLRGARLVVERREGTRHFFRATPAGLFHLKRYLESLWDDVLAAFAGQKRSARRASAKEDPWVHPRPSRSRRSAARSRSRGRPRQRSAGSRRESRPLGRSERTRSASAKRRPSRSRGGSAAGSSKRSKAGRSARGARSRHGTRRGASPSPGIPHGKSRASRMRDGGSRGTRASRRRPRRTPR